MLLNYYYFFYLNSIAANALIKRADDVIFCVIHVIIKIEKKTEGRIFLFFKIIWAIIISYIRFRYQNSYKGNLITFKIFKCKIVKKNIIERLICFKF